MKGSGRIHNLSDKNITCLNGEELTEDRPLRHGDTVTIGGADLRFEAITELEYQQNTARRIRKSKPLPPWTSFVYVTVLQFLSRHSALYFQTGKSRQETAISVTESLRRHVDLCTGVPVYGKDRIRAGDPGFFRLFSQSGYHGHRSSERDVQTDDFHSSRISCSQRWDFISETWIGS